MRRRSFQTYLQSVFAPVTFSSPTANVPAGTILDQSKGSFHVINNAYIPSSL